MIKLYVVPDSLACDQTRKYCKKYSVDFEVIKVLKIQGLLKELQNDGYTQWPVVKTNIGNWEGFQPSLIDKYRRKVKMKWTQEYPKVEGFYWIKRGDDGFPKVEDFWPGENGRLCAIDKEFKEYYQECFKGYWFSSEPIKEPEE